jgi:lambda repressor-like predicted transcriptional regulator
MKTWQDRIAELEASGMSLTDIGHEIKLSPQSLSDIKQGRSKEPRGMAAVKLHALHERLCGGDQSARAA